MVVRYERQSKMKNKRLILIKLKYKIPTNQFTRLSFALMATTATAVPARGRRYCSRYSYQMLGSSPSLTTSVVVSVEVSVVVTRVTIVVEVGRRWPVADLPILGKAAGFRDKVECSVYFSQLEQQKDQAIIWNKN